MAWPDGSAHRCASHEANRRDEVRAAFQRLRHYGMKFKKECLSSYTFWTNLEDNLGRLHKWLGLGYGIRIRSGLHTSLVQSTSEEHKNMINSGLRGGRRSVVLPIFGLRRFGEGLT